MTINVFVAGHDGMVGSAIVRQLESANGVCSIVTRSRSALDLSDQQEVAKFFENNEIDHDYMAAVKVGGIYANNEYPAEFIYENLMIEANIIHQAYSSKVEKLLFLDFSCIYSRLAEPPMAESVLLTATLESTNEPYAIAKIAGIKLCEYYNRQYGVDYRSVMRTNLYGPCDNFHPGNSLVLLALILRFNKAKLNGNAEVVVWGPGKPMREFLHADDMVQASVYVMNLEKQEYLRNTKPMLSHINVGSGIDCAIKELAQTVSSAVGYMGNIVFDSSKPDGWLPA